MARIPRDTIVYFIEKVISVYNSVNANELLFSEVYDDFISSILLGGLDWDECERDVQDSAIDQFIVYLFVGKGMHRQTLQDMWIETLASIPTDSSHLDDRLKKLIVDFILRFQSPSLASIMGLIRQGANPNVTDPLGNTALVCYLRGAIGSQIPVSADLKELLNITDKCALTDGDQTLTPLQIAVADDNVPLIKDILDTGKYNSEIEDILAYALHDDECNEFLHKSTCNWNTFKALVDMGASLDAKFEDQNLLDLCQSSHSCDSKIISYLKKHGVESSIDTEELIYKVSDLLSPVPRTLSSPLQVEKFLARRDLKRWISEVLEIDTVETVSKELVYRAFIKSQIGRLPATDLYMLRFVDGDFEVVSSPQVVTVHPRPNLRSFAIFTVGNPTVCHDDLAQSVSNLVLLTKYYKRFLDNPSDSSFLPRQLAIFNKWKSCNFLGFFDTHDFFCVQTRLSYMGIPDGVDTFAEDEEDCEY